MSDDVRQRRLQRGSQKPASLSLVSLMDIFTILVFFLLVNSSSTQQSQSGSLKLPEAKVKTPVPSSIQIQVDDKNLIVQGRVILALKDIAESEETIPVLEEELSYLFKRQQERGLLVEGEQTVTLLADKQLEYALLKKIMVSSGRSGYEKVSLAVIGQAQEAVSEHL